MPEPLWPWLIVAGVLPMLGALAWRRSRSLPALLLWVGAPIVLMFALGLFSDAFLKFLLVASPAWCILVAGAAEIAPMRWARSRTVAALLVAGFCRGRGAGCASGVLQQPPRP